MDLKKRNYYITSNYLFQKNSKVTTINETLFDRSLNVEPKEKFIDPNIHINYNNHLYKSNKRYSKKVYSGIKRDINSFVENLTYTFSYKNNSYEFDETLNKFKPIFFFLGNLTNIEIHDKLGEGLKNLTQYNYALNRYGLNEILSLKYTFFNFFIKQIRHPFYIYQLICYVSCFLSDNIISLVFLLVLSGVIIFINAYLYYVNWEQIFMNEEKKGCLAKRNLSEYDIKEGYIYDSINLFILNFLIKKSFFKIIKNSRKFVLK